MRHFVAIAMFPFPATMVFPPVGGGLVPATSLPTPGSVSELPTVSTAVALPSIVPNADLELGAALEALDLVQLKWVRIRHGGGKAALDSGRGG